ncbi:MAG TPA: hypothetical protein VGF79_16760 [Bacteroidia bacterium]
MTELILSIALSGLLFIIFKWMDGLKVWLLAAITANYLACIAIGSAAGQLNFSGYTTQTIVLCLCFGLLFFSVFYCMGYSSSHIGVGITGAATKLSLIIPILVATLILHEPFSISKLLAIILALTSIFLMSNRDQGTQSLKLIFIPLFIFLGSGTIDTLLGIMKQHLIKENLSQATSIVLIFTGALLPASALTLRQISKQKNILRDLGLGCVLGTVNYFSVHFMLLALGNGKFSMNEFFLINNSGVVALTFAAGLLLFGEKANLRKLIGLALCLLSIFLILYGN